MEDVIFSLALFFKKGIGPKRYLNLIKSYENLQDAIKEEKIELKEELKRAEKELKEALKKKVEIVPLCSPKYPELLKEISQPPIVLYVKGNLESSSCISIVGSRKTTSYGKRISFSLGKFLAENEICVVSGLAYGIDTFSHEGALKGKGKTVAVLGTGVDVIYPRGNYNLAEKILEEGGALVSEFPLGAEPAKENFPRRNRIISGLSYATI
ncbi:MAG: DNA-processing protein DprA, partial [Desulfurobacteriaceae bacterium]